ncbi:uncharacterized protein I206_100726 [Kwoniella pini CBS 10737]|uniref:AAA+ ATPase domain-containing protein n=1 Tax=Kwoniella pini CBS 10737 TaxID=1296096 RepID=A0A1B9IDA4_9TREE|nr:uncharacterized protein I206_00601 [Kwoniella pini CBS 10737]OCF53300.1 hypothetical protein I206_00601 [Kwoniella pini CBS 10737]
MSVLQAPPPTISSLSISSTDLGQDMSAKHSANHYNGFSTSHSMKSIASTSTNGYTNGYANGHHHDDIEYEEDMEDNVLDHRLNHGDANSEASEEAESYYDVHLEVRLLPNSVQTTATIRYWVLDYMENSIANLVLGAELRGWQRDRDMKNHIATIWVEEADRKSIPFSEVNLNIHVYRLLRNEQVADFDNDLEDTEHEESVSAGSMRTLPSTELDGLWQTLVYADNLKTRLLNFCYSTTYFSENNIDFNMIAWNRVILLHGPPGTGKTSLCRALAQKISIRMRDSYPRSKLIEINSHSLFSKWFSESGKLVQKLFDTITREVDNEEQFVVLMIDEVESLTAARSAAMTGNEPSDSLRVVNALLTQLDKLRTRKNVLVMTTSNLVDAIDEAFMSRVDMVELVPLPPPEAIYYILKGCIEEMMSKNMIKNRQLLEWTRAEDQWRTWKKSEDKIKRYSGALAQLAIKCYEKKVSGRTLRKLPVLAHTSKLSKFSGGQNRKRSLEDWIKAMLEIIDSFSQSSELIKKNNNDQSEVKRTHQKSTSVVSIDRSELGHLVATRGE